MEPLSERLEELKDEYIERLGRAEAAEARAAGLMEEDEEENEFTRPPTHKIKSKNGVVNFDIDVDSGDDDGDEDEQEGTAVGPKDTVLELNQSMMRVELMDEVLERIRDLIKDRL